jgi:hypothetical protein
VDVEVTKGTKNLLIFFCSARMCDFSVSSKRWISNDRENVLKNLILRVLRRVKLGDGIVAAVEVVGSGVVLSAAASYIVSWPERKKTWHHNRTNQLHTPKDIIDRRCWTYTEIRHKRILTNRRQQNLLNIQFLRLPRRILWHGNRR